MISTKDLKKIKTDIFSLIQKEKEIHSIYIAEKDIFKIAKPKSFDKAINIKFLSKKNIGVSLFLKIDKKSSAHNMKTILEEKIKNKLVLNKINLKWLKLTIIDLK